MQRTASEDSGYSTNDSTISPARKVSTSSPVSACLPKPLAPGAAATCLSLEPPPTEDTEDMRMSDEEAENKERNSTQKV